MVIVEFSKNLEKFFGLKIYLKVSKIVCKWSWYKKLFNGVYEAAGRFKVRLSNLERSLTHEQSKTDSKTLKKEEEDKNVNPERQLYGAGIAD